ncbi:MAG TPA: aldehyde dehydrogenase family protein [Verrucomicrobiae bacterium]|jgi:NADP-dependent aldehyde dehydrogenase
MTTHPVLIAGQWRAAQSTGTFQAENPATGETLPDQFPVSSWADCDAALTAAAQAAVELRSTPPEKIAAFLQRFAERIEARAPQIVDCAHLETALAKSPRLADVELPRTTGQLRQAAAAALEGSWATPTIDKKLNIRSMLAPIGPVWVFGPNNFPLAYNSVAGGDFAAAIATGNPVIAKSNSSHPGTSRLLAEEAFAAVKDVGLPAATVQLIYRTGHADGERLVADPRTAALAYTGSRSAGLKLKAAADCAGKMSYLELSSVNPLLILPGALAERGPKMVDEFTGSCLMATGQFCTSPSFVLLFAGQGTDQFIEAIRQKFDSTTPGVLLSAGVLKSLGESVHTLRAAGAELITGGSPVAGPSRRFANTLLRVTGAQFLAKSEELQTEAFGNATLVVVVHDAAEAAAVLTRLEGNLTGSIYSDTKGADDELYAQLAPLVRSRVGRFLNDKMPTGVAVTAAMNHGGPYPSTGHPGFTAVGFPASLRRFAMLQCFDNVRPDRLPPALRDANPTGKMWRLIDGQWTQASVSAL